ncbi:MAG: tetratricopeptide repeat protein [Syntrophobacterales bacterium]
MATQDFKRKLTAIFTADVEGYSRLMREDEEATVRTITSYRKMMTRLIQQYRGRVVDSPGDNILAEFVSVVDAVNCAVEIQRELAERNADLPDNRKMVFRIGVNLGDVIEEGERIYGDGVNIAARVEGLAEGGGICISGTVYDAIEAKLGLEYEYLGEQEVKNIDRPVRVYRVLSFPGAAAHRVIKAKKAVERKWLNTALAVTAILVVGIAALAIWNFSLRPTPTTEELVSDKKMAFPLPDKPSLAVLPFDNLSGDSSQEYFSDGITESIITALSNVKTLFVIARNSSFTYKGKPVKVQQVAEELGVRYVLEGSVQKSEDRVRITAQLIDALKGHHLWAENYDRTFDDIFALQDDITEHVTIALQVKLTAGEQAQIRRAHMDNPEAYEYFLRGREEYANFTKENNDQARKLWEKALELDPNNSWLWQQIGWTYYRDARFGWTDTPVQSLDRAEELALKTLAVDDSHAEAYCLMSVVYMSRRQHDKAVAYGEKTLALAPNFADIQATIAIPFMYSGRAEEAIELVQHAMRLSPYYPAWYLPVLGMAYRFTGQYDKAIDAMEGWRARANPRSALPHLFLAIFYVEAGRGEEAQVAVAEVLKRNPKASITGYLKAKTFPYKYQADIDKVVDSLRKAGLPEEPPLALPDKPSIAVLAFDNMSADPEQEYLADGISEHIIFALSKISKLFVIARHSSFTYKGKPVKVQQVSRELGVRYVLEGSVQRAGDRLRVTAQLIDATTGGHLWSESYVQELKDIFAVQDGITKNIVSAMQVKLTEGEQARATAKGTNNLEAYLKCLQANELIHRVNPESNALAKQLAEEAVALDPEYAWAYYNLGRAHQLDVFLRVSKSPQRSIGKAIGFMKKAIALDDTLAEAHGRLGYIYSMIGKYDEGIAQAEKGVALNPNSAMAHMMLGKTLSFAGRWEESIPVFKKAIRLNPFPTNFYVYSIGISYAFTGQYEEARTWCEKAVRQEPDSLYARIMMTVVYSWSGQDEKARAEAAEVLRIQPKYTIRKSRYKREEDIERFDGALRKAGLT